jgi:hypothetical protein
MLATTPTTPTSVAVATTPADSMVNDGCHSISRRYLARTQDSPTAPMAPRAPARMPRMPYYTATIAVTRRVPAPRVR